MDTKDLVDAAKFAIIAGIKISRTGEHDGIPSLREVEENTVEK